jgi:hypothetical protein
MPMTLHTSTILLRIQRETQRHYVKAESMDTIHTDSLKLNMLPCNHPNHHVKPPVTNTITAETPKITLPTLEVFLPKSLNLPIATHPNTITIAMTESSAEQPVMKFTGNVPGRYSVSEWYGFVSFKYQYRDDPPISNKKKGKLSRMINKMIHNNSTIEKGGRSPGGTLLYSKSVTANSESGMVVTRGVCERHI